MPHVFFGDVILALDEEVRSSKCEIVSQIEQPYNKSGESRPEVRDRSELIAGVVEKIHEVIYLLYDDNWVKITGGDHHEFWVLLV